MPTYGYLHSLSDFFGRTIPKTGPTQKSFVHVALSAVKRLDAVQEANPGVTLSVNAGDGIWVSKDGLRRCLIMPSQRHLRVLTTNDPVGIAEALDQAVYDGHAVDGSQLNYRQWKLGAEGVSILLNVFESWPKPNLTVDSADPRHPRNFPGSVRQAALEEFSRQGNHCEGVHGVRRRHKVDLRKERIEFDHILPHSRGGSNMQWNVQILCMECNRMKRDSSK
jgi:hypothetical protein